MKDKLIYAIFGIIIGILLSLNFSKVETIPYTIPIKFKIPEIKKDTTLIDSIQNLVSVLDSLEEEIEKMKKEKQIKWSLWEYDDKYLYAKMHYWGLLKDFHYTIKARDTVVITQVKIKVKKYVDWRWNFVNFLGGMGVAYFLMKGK